MSINRLLSNEEKRNEFVNDSKETFKGVLGIGGLAAILGGGLSTKERRKNYSPTKGSNTKLGEAGGALKSSVDKAFDIRTTRDLAGANSFFDDLIEEASSILGRTIKNSIEDTPELTAEAKQLQRAIHNEKTYLLTAVKDAIRDLGITGDVGSSDLLMKEIDRVLESDMSRSGDLSEEVENVLKSIRNNTNSDKRIDQFKRFKGLKENSRYFSGKAKALGVSGELIRQNPVLGNIDEAFKTAVSMHRGGGMRPEDVSFTKGEQSLFERLQTRAQEYNKSLGVYGGNVQSFSVVQEHQGRLPSIYMNVGGRNKTLNYKVPLTLSSTGRSRKIIRGTGTMNTPFAMSSFMIGFDDAQSLLNKPTTKKEVEEVLGRSTPERFVQKKFLDFLSGTGGLVDDVSERDVNRFSQYIRSNTININKATLYNETDNPLGERLFQQLVMQQEINSNQAIVFDVMGSQREAQNIPIRLSQKFPEYFDAPQASATPIRKEHIPGMGDLLGINVNVLQYQEKALATPFTLTRGFGIKNRATTPLTSREAQFYGRPDLLSGISVPGEKTSHIDDVSTSVNMFGRKKNIPIMAANEALLSIDPEVGRQLTLEKAGRVQGANMAGLLFFGSEEATRAGIVEGQAFYGGTMEVQIPIQKSVLDPEKMGRPEYAYLRQLIEKSKNSNLKELRVRGEDVTKIFKLYSNERGEIPLGEIDNRIVGLKRYAGLKDFTLKIDPLEGVVDDKGRYKYSISGKVTLQSEENKLFGILGRTTSFGGRATPDDMINILSAGYSGLGEAEGRLAALDVMSIAKKEFGVSNRALMIGDESGVAKAADFISNYMYGGYRFLGGEDRFLPKYAGNTEELSKVLSGATGESLNANQREFVRAKLIEQARSLAIGLQESGENVSSKALALLLGPIKYLEGSSKFGLQEGDLEKHVLSGLNLNYNKAEMEEVFKLRTALGGASMFAGSPKQILGRNMAKMEPRHANILMYGMRTFFGLNTEQSVKYLNDFVLRQEGIEYSARYLPDLVGLGMSFKSKMNSSIEGKQIKRLTPEAFEKLGVAAQTIMKGDPSKGDEFRRIMLETLDYDNPTALNISDFVKNKDARERLAKEIPTGQILIPSGKTIEGMKNYQIVKSDGVENIDARTLGNLKGLFENIYEMDRTPNPERRVKAVGTLTRDIVDTASMALRRSISGKVLGSASMQGQGLMLNDKYAMKNLNKDSLQAMQSFYAKNQGYAIFTNTGGLIDSLNTFMGAATKTNIIQDASDALAERNAQDKMLGKYKNFMFGHMDESLDSPVRGLTLRSPSMSITHILAGIALGRSDVGTSRDVSEVLSKQSKEFISGLMGGSASEITPEDIYRMEMKYKGDANFKAKVDSSNEIISANRKEKIQTQFGKFQKRSEKFFGQNAPAQMNVNPANVQSINEALDYMKSQKGKEVVGITRALFKMKASLDSSDNMAESLFRSAHLDVIKNYHTKYGVGSGSIIFPTFEADIKFEGSDKVMSSRLDTAYSMIGDFDADTYQFFHETKNISQAAMLARGEDIVGNITEASAKFGIIRNLFSESFDELGRKLGSGEMSIAQFRADQAKKEVILKNVGPVDVQFKSTLLGMVENSLRATPENASSIREAAYLMEQLGNDVVNIANAATGTGSLQDISVLKAKKLPFAAELGSMLGDSMRHGLQTGDTSAFYDMFEKMILNNSEALKKGITISDIDLRGTSEEVQEMYRKRLVGKRIEGYKILDAIIEGIKTSHREGFYLTGSENRMSKALNQHGGSLKGAFEALLIGRKSLEMSMLGEPASFKAGGSAADLMVDVMDQISGSAARAKSRMLGNMKGKGMAGLLGAGLVSSYALGASYSTSSLDGPDKFSDTKVKEYIGQRAIYNSMEATQHKDVSAASMRPEQNMYQRNIMQNQMYVNKPSGIAMRGNVSNMGDANKILQSISSMGGRGHVSIQDNVVPRPNLADYYMRDY
jgi:hypothetical protein